MKVRIAAVGRMKAGPERSLVHDYLTRFGRTGRTLGLGPAEVVEVEAKKGGMPAEADLLRKAVGGAARRVVLDERGKLLSSREFSNLIAGYRDMGLADMAFVIGGADGVHSALRDEADVVMSFGQMVWPHMLVRVMLAEQLYRAASILAGAPYHRD